MKKFVSLSLAVLEVFFCARAWAYGGDPGGGTAGSGAPEIPAGAGPFVLAGAIGVVFLVRRFFRK